MLVLSATFYNKALHRIVPEPKFQRLLERTIRFLRKLAPLSPTSYNDCQILEKISKLLFGGAPQEAKHLYRGEIEPQSLPGSAATSFAHST